MKITKRQLRRIIKEELSLLVEQDLQPGTQTHPDQVDPDNADDTADTLSPDVWGSEKPWIMDYQDSDFKGFTISEDFLNNSPEELATFAWDSVHGIFTNESKLLDALYTLDAKATGVYLRSQRDPESGWRRPEPMKLASSEGGQVITQAYDHIARTKNKNLWAKIMGDLSGKAARNFGALLGDWRSKGWVDVDAYHDAIN